MNKKSRNFRCSTDDCNCRIQVTPDSTNRFAAIIIFVDTAATLA